MKIYCSPLIAICIKKKESNLAVFRDIMTKCGMAIHWCINMAMMVSKAG